eukprot:TRINITY_DN3321_c0_g1_i1.p3 TRINITY_DN3321_c0_g1~~TRINITY_DN3321_c0_g1_i1.p3  ORF type:complete len:158 (+),score=18.61 TRINITY_DN3321_c0_g1_i1:51-524(+)
MVAQIVYKLRCRFADQETNSAYMGSSSSKRSPTDKMALRQKIDSAITDNKVFVISKSYCPYCAKAKRSLQQYTTDFAVWEIENDPDCREIQSIMREITGGSSVPRVFIGGKFIGGGDETAAADANGSLQKMLVEVGAAAAQNAVLFNAVTHVLLLAS